MPDEQLLYMGVPDPLDLRKDLLNSSKILLGSLKKYENYNEMKKEKAKYVAELAKTFKELNILNRRIKQLLPKAKLKPGMIRQPTRPIAPKISPAAIMAAAEERHVKKPEAKAAAPAPKIIREKSKLAHLEDELAQVEQKLKKLE